MRNKLIILTFALVFSGVTLAQGGSDFSQESKISIYPNPAVEHIFVQLDSEFSNAEFELNSMIGNKLQIKPEEVGLGKYKIPVKDLATGYYFLIIKDEDRRFKKAYKFLKH
ncbi:T9SS type A sorting domain-containing protein [Ekhidna sp.]|uniref:T9SS type A sorting domain-containing protein n=1 Tax=Ekhidna sp. TaxID=2608089 RepID=UPI003B5B42F7